MVSQFLFLALSCIWNVFLIGLRQHLTFLKMDSQLSEHNRMIGLFILSLPL